MSRTRTRPPAPRRRRRPLHSRAPRRTGLLRLKWYIVLLILIFIPTGIYVSKYSMVVRQQFEGKHWALPARVYASPLELYTGMKLSPAVLMTELSAIGYKKTKKITGAGQYQKKYNDIYFMSRQFKFWDANEPSRLLRARFRNNTLQSIYDVKNNSKVSLTRIEPRLIGKIYPAHNEDRELVHLDELPPLLVKALIAVEDRHFYDHYGVSIRGVARATVANLKAGGVVQGGSTITQQLIKNLYLSPETTLKRKLNEATMALLLEWHYEKEQILEAYINEVFLGQDGNRAIHGFGLASWFYFNRPLKELKLPEIALLVGLVQGASSLNPRKFPKNALKRRNVVLDVLVTRGVVDMIDAENAKLEPLGIAKKRHTRSPYPAFLDLVRRQLREDYREEDLRSEGLQIFTTLDPRVQARAEASMVKGIKRLERENRKRTKKLEGAMVVTDSQNGEVIALVNGRKPRYAGFNRPLDAVRTIGSLVKSAVYLTALENSQTYSLTSTLDDSPYEWKDEVTGKTWKPRNYDHRPHGKVSLHYALAQSYNLATVHLGMELGLNEVRNTLSRLGVEREFKTYPSMLLGGISLTPMDVAQMYQTIASGGFRVPLRAIRNVLDHRGLPIQRYGLNVEQHFSPESIFLLNYALQHAIRNGTGKHIAKELPRDLVVAGKTGTSNNLRDSWFAGFSGNLLAITWLGRDDNKPIGLSGGQGALRVWADFMKKSQQRSLSLTPSPQIQWRWVDFKSGEWSRRGTPRAVKMPFIVNTVAENRTTSNYSKWFQ